MKIHVSLSSKGNSRGSRHNLWFGAKTRAELNNLARVIFAFKGTLKFPGPDWQPIYNDDKVEVGYDPEEGLAFWGSSKHMQKLITKALPEATMYGSSRDKDSLNIDGWRPYVRGKVSPSDGEPRYSSTEVKAMAQNQLRNLARAMVYKVYSTPSIKARMERSPEPIRAIIYESGLVTDPEDLDDGSATYEKLASLIEKQY